MTCRQCRRSDVVFYVNRRTCRDCMQAQQRQRRSKGPAKPRKRRKKRERAPDVVRLTGCPLRIALGADALDDPRWAHLCMHRFYAEGACDQPARWHNGAMRLCDTHRGPSDAPLRR